MSRYGEPEDIIGECNARLYIGDNFHDNHATIRCQRDPNHEGKHREEYTAYGTNVVVIEWDHDERTLEGEDQ